MAHDNAVEIYVNGVLAFKGVDFNGAQEPQIPLPAAAALLRANADIQLAVHCHQDEGGQMVDVRLIDIAPPEQEPAPKHAGQCCTKVGIDHLDVFWNKERNEALFQNDERRLGYSSNLLENNILHSMLPKVANLVRHSAGLTGK